MSFHTEILTRFESVLAEKNDEITQAVVDQIVKQHFHGQLPAEMVREFCEKFYLSPIILPFVAFRLPLVMQLHLSLNLM